MVSRQSDGQSGILVRQEPTVKEKAPAKPAIFGSPHATKSENVGYISQISIVIGGIHGKSNGSNR
jgi:hypothetical protein